MTGLSFVAHLNGVSRPYDRNRPDAGTPRRLRASGALPPRHAAPIDPFVWRRP
ncbi:hypothetical protein C7S16_0809 [Burkholderia thailandensis]|uniref:Uncharacterized protein n=1 Tax=Burkholderia thailandensis TaxID=57975 RepID=A0AAW9CV98_BURTH|nr:hypothetical protein [Burkholderia thailandensis]MDW9254347.1 hypothetical protein [Burkholderia thailandensis]